MTSQGPIKGNPRSRGFHRVVDVCIPVYRDDPTELIRQLSRQTHANRSVLHVYDDGSCDPTLTDRITAALAGYPGRVDLMTIPVNLGRAAARNALIKAARGDWLLFLDGDMRIDGSDFLLAYMDAAARQERPSCIVGGFALDFKQVRPDTRLHPLQAKRSECLNAAMRNSDPGRFVFASNVFLHREIIESIQFNSNYRGWGWEDVDWGLNIARRYPVVHIDNPAIHLGLDDDRALLRKYAESGPNFMLMLRDHPESVRRMPLYRYARLLSHLPLLPAMTWVTRNMAIRGRSVLPARLRLLALKLFRVSIYARALDGARLAGGPRDLTHSDEGALIRHDG